MNNVQEIILRNSETTDLNSCNQQNCHLTNASRLTSLQVCTSCKLPIVSKKDMRILINHCYREKGKDINVKSKGKYSCMSLELEPEY